MAEKAGKTGAFYAMTGSKTTKTLAPIGTGDAATTIFYLTRTLVACENDTDWTGNALTNPAGKDSNCIQDQEPDPVTMATEYKTVYNPSGTWDWHDVTRLSFWLKSDRISTAFTWARIVLSDGTNESYWDLTFAAATWTRFNILLSTPDGNNGTDCSLTAVTSITFNFKAADTTTFYKQIDMIGLTPQAVDKDITVKVAGTEQGKDKYLHTVSGKLTFETAPGDEDAITVTYDYYAISQVGGFFNWAITQAVGTLDKTDFQSGGHKEFLAGLKEWSASAERHWLTDESLAAWLGVTKIIKLFLDESSDPQLRYEGWAIVNGLNPAVAVDTIINESLSFQGTGQLSYESS